MTSRAGSSNDVVGINSGRFMMASSEGPYQPLGKARDFAVFPCDGFVTSVIQTPADATLQVSFWIVDGSPDGEDNSLQYENPQHYQYTYGVKHTLQTAVKLKPDAALQMALNILETVSKLNDDIRKKYSLPQSVNLDNPGVGE